METCEICADECEISIKEGAGQIDETRRVEEAKPEDARQLALNECLKLVKQRGAMDNAQIAALFVVDCQFLEDKLRVGTPVKLALQDKTHYAAISGSSVIGLYPACSIDAIMKAARAWYGRGTEFKYIQFKTDAPLLVVAEPDYARNTTLAGLVAPRIDSGEVA